jgi:hypothetical protein
MDTLMNYFGSSLDRDTIWGIFKDNSFDLDKTISQLSTLTGIKLPEYDEKEGKDLQDDQKFGDTIVLL